MFAIVLGATLVVAQAPLLAASSGKTRAAYTILTFRLPRWQILAGQTWPRLLGCCWRWPGKRRSWLGLFWPVAAVQDAVARAVLRFYGSGRRAVVVGVCHQPMVCAGAAPHAGRVRAVGRVPRGSLSVGGGRGGAPGVATAACLLYGSCWQRLLCAGGRGAVRQRRIRALCSGCVPARRSRCWLCWPCLLCRARSGAAPGGDGKVRKAAPSAVFIPAQRAHTSQEVPCKCCISGMPPAAEPAPRAGRIAPVLVLLALVAALESAHRCFCGCAGRTGSSPLKQRTAPLPRLKVSRCKGGRFGSGDTGLAFTLSDGVLTSAPRPQAAGRPRSPQFYEQCAACCAGRGLCRPQRRG